MWRPSNESGLALEGSPSCIQDRVVSGPCAVDPTIPARKSPVVGKRRTFSAEYRLRILREADSCRRPGELSALLRREGLQSSHLALWRRQRDGEALSGMRARKRGPKTAAVDQRVQDLQRQNARLERLLREAETTIEAQKKIATMLAIPLRA